MRINLNHTLVLLTMGLFIVLLTLCSTIFITSLLEIPVAVGSIIALIVLTIAGARYRNRYFQMVVFVLSFICCGLIMCNTLFYIGFYSVGFAFVISTILVLSHMWSEKTTYSLPYVISILSFTIITPMAVVFGTISFGLYGIAMGVILVLLYTIFLYQYIQTGTDIFNKERDLTFYQLFDKTYLFYDKLIGYMI